jgi:hypothetical protein
MNDKMTPIRHWKRNSTISLDLRRRALRDDKTRKLGPLLEESKLRVVSHRDAKANGINVDIVTMKDGNEQRVVAYFYSNGMGKVTKIC